MTDPRVWKAANEIVQAALELEPSARDAYCRERSQGDADVLAEVQSLLAWQQASTGFLETPVARVADLPTSPADDLALIGSSLGPWRIDDIVGRGGMGVVYLAHRVDQAFDKPAAVKVVREAAASNDIVERFKRERQTLASLEHQHIARVMDAGTTPAGLPYLVLEYVDGVPLDRYCDEHRLGVDARLAMFRQVCAAVQHAHQNLVVHRDIKPDNVLVSKSGQPKLIDFGVAKLVPALASAQDESFAATWIMTPDFASPEQVFGEPITTATDVYSLGVLLYVLLTGTSPYRVSGASRGEIQDALRHASLAQASDVAGHDSPDAARRAERRSTTPAALQARLRGDLDAILRRALARDVGQRYPTVEQLAADIDDHLAHRPVSARSTERGYRAWRFARRHALAVSLGMAAVLLLAAGLAGTTWQARRAAAAQARAERRFNEVRRLANVFMFDIHDAIVDVPGTTKARALMVHTATEYLESLAGEAGTDAALMRELAAAFVRVGDAQGHPTSANIGDTAGARASYERAIAIAQGLLQDANGDVEVTRTLAAAHRQLADVLAWSGDLPGAVQHSELSAERFRWLGSQPNATKNDRFAAGVADIKLGDVLGNPNFPNAGRGDEALPHYFAAIDVFRRLVTEEPSAQGNRRLLGVALERLGTMYETKTQWRDAGQAYQESFEIRRALAADAPFHNDIQRDLAIAYEKVGKVQEGEKDFTSAVASYRGALAQFERLARADPANAIAARSVAISQQNLAGALAQAGNAREAVELLGAAARAHASLAERDASNAQARCDEARVALALADTWERAEGLGSAADRRASVCRAWADTQRGLDAWRRASRDGCLSDEDTKRVEESVRECVAAQAAR